MTTLRLAMLAALVSFASASAADPGELPSSLPALPAGGGILNVRDAAFGAVGDGIADDTAAIQKALSEALDSHRIVYLPAGTYRVSDQLRWWRPGYNLEHVNGWGAFLQLQGQGRSSTIIRLADAAPGFTDPAKPKAVVATGSRGYHGNKGYRSGEGNEAFENHIRDLTVDVGSGNPGAVGIDYQVSNAGALRNVTVRSRDPGSGAIGIDLRRRDNGPGLIADVLVDGFAVGLRTGQSLAHLNLKDVRLRNQREVGISNHEAILTINGLVSENRVPAVVNSGVGHLTVVDCRATGGAADGHAIRNEGAAAVTLVRNLSVAGYAGAIAAANPPSGASVPFWSSHAVVGDAARAAACWLPGAQTPRYAVPSPEQWAWLPQPSGGDDTDVVQRALDSGKPVLALGAGRWFISDTLTVPASLRLIYGLGAEIDTKLGDWGKDAAFLRLAGGTAKDVLIIDRLAFGGTCPLFVEHEDGRTLVLRDLLFFGGSPYRSQGGAKRLFIEDVAGNGYRIGPGAQVWADQMDTEGDHLNTIDRAQLLAYGFKHEGHGTLFRASNATVQLLGGLFYSFGGVPADQPGVQLQDSPGSLLSLVNVTFVGDGSFPLALRTITGPATSDLRRDALPRRQGGWVLPLAVTGQ